MILSSVARCTTLAFALVVTACAPFRPVPETITRGDSRWVATRWDELPGWRDDAVHEAWPALLRSCERPSPEWASACASARAATAPRNDAQARAWFVDHLQPYRLEPLRGAPPGLITGYYEPTFDARRVPGGEFRVPLHALPPDLATRKPYWTRQQIETLPAAQSALRGRELVYLADPLDALALQIQGSGRTRVTEADGRLKVVRMAYAGHNDQPYRS
ncbi:MAG TPA: MltA domain-containing protein, partial [Steroidobacteraceae bacterium]|nr:MltA domain-containing protein [Steroidobacteraceae bacterium]